MDFQVRTYGFDYTEIFIKRSWIPYNVSSEYFYWIEQNNKFNLYGDKRR